MKNTKCLVVIFALFGALFTISTSASGQAVQWTQAEGGNGNWYEAVDIDSTYQAARSYSEDLGGHLVSLTSADEDTWVYTNLDGGDARWIGAYQDINSPEYSEPDGAWGWVSGEAWSYTNWNGGGPDNGGLAVPDEEVGHYCCGGAWNDLYEVTNGSPVERKFIMEWSADCNGDGMVDYGQILSGELADDDGNGVPDICQPITVDDDGSADFTTLQAAVDASSDGDTILVLPGTYSGSGGQVVRLNGKNIVITSSEGSGTTIIDGQNTRRGIVVANSETDVTIEGFTVTNCTTGGGGGGVLVGESASPTFRNLIITDNNAGADGAGVNAGGAGTVRFEQCDIINNAAQGGNGGGIASNNTAIEIIDCTFTGNSAAIHGGGIYIDDSPATLTGCDFNSNTSSDYGGAIALPNGTANLSDCNFTGNQAQYGGAVGQYFSTANSNSTFTDCQFINNTTIGNDPDGGGFYASAGSIATFDNCVFRNNSSPWRGGGASVHSGADVSMLNCEISNNSAGSSPGSITGGGGIINSGGTLNLSDTIVCGNTPDQVGGQNGYNDNGGNFVEDICQCAGDIIEDGVVNLVDFSQFLIDFGSTGESVSDLNGDLVVDLNDFSIFLVNYGNVCETRSAVAETGLGKVAPTHHIGGVPRRSMN